MIKESLFLLPVVTGLAILELEFCSTDKFEGMQQDSLLSFQVIYDIVEENMPPQD
jgi:hypothetical protein